MNKKISELLETINLKEEDILMILQNGQNKKIKAMNFFKETNSKIDNINDKLIKVSATEPSLKSDIWLKKGKNFFNKNNIVKNYYIKDDDGSISEYDSNMCYCFNYFEVEPNTKYTMSNSTDTIFLIAEYDENKNFIKQNRQNNSNNFLTITTNQTTKYIRISMGITQINTIQFEVGVKTEYEEYIEPNIYVNNNGTYVLFKEEKITNIQMGKEVETGNLVDGKKEYVIKTDFGALPNNTVKGINTGLKNSYTYLRIFGIARKNDGTRYWVIPNEHIKLDFENGWITITTKEDLSMFNATLEIYYTKQNDNQAMLL